MQNTSPHITQLYPTPMVDNLSVSHRDLSKLSAVIEYRKSDILLGAITLWFWLYESIIL